MKKVITIMVMLLLILLFFSCASGKESGESAGYMRISMMVGTAEVRLSGAAFRPARVGMLLRQNDVVKTLGHNSSCSLSTPGGSVVRLGGDSLLIMKKLYQGGKIKAEKTGLELFAGKVIVRTKKLFNKESFAVRTKSAIAGVRGTQFVVSIDENNNTSVGVKSGRVLVSRKLSAPDKTADRVVKTLAKENPVLLKPDQQVVIKNSDNVRIVKAAREELKEIKTEGAEKPVIKEVIQEVIEKVSKAVKKQRVTVKPESVRFDYKKDRQLEKDFEALEKLKIELEKKKASSSAKEGQGDSLKAAHEGVQADKEPSLSREEIEARRKKFEAERLRALKREKMLRERKTQDDRE